MSDVPEPKEPYQRKLMAFIAPIPAVGGADIVSGTPALPNPTEASFKAIKGKTRTDPHFKAFTGYEHETLLGKWLKDRTTTCNEFCGRCAVAMGTAVDMPIGRFDIAEWLSGRGLGHAWVPADSGALPEYGDIFRLYGPNPDHNGETLNHMAVSLHVVGKDWFTVESGQGGPLKGFDAIRRRKREWKPVALRGWVSIRALLNSGKPLPYWLGGWWEVQEEPYDTYYYYFDASGKVSFTTKKPAVVGSPPVLASVVGNFSVKGMFGLNIMWNSADVDETFMCVQQDAIARRFVMEGKTARGIKMKATRMQTNYG